MSENKLLIQENCKKRFENAVQEVETLVTTSKQSRLIVGIDGQCASGKTTLGYYLKSLFDCNLFHMDDFFLQQWQRTKERLLEVGGNVDYERFKKEVIEPVRLGKEVDYRPYRCMDGTIMEGQRIPWKRLTIIEGSYSLHPYFGDCYDLRIFTEISKKEQIERIRRRNGEEKLKRFIAEWIPKEEAYFTKFETKKDCIWIGEVE
ncbi:MAG: hypothetical protein Q4F05_12490 [bacterium]|nr:hypothetical protein [bacterium]